jgi:hypothetical protein
MPGSNQRPLPCEAAKLFFMRSNVYEIPHIQAESSAPSWIAILLFSLIF